MADVTTTFAAKDESFASTVDKLNGRLQGFQKDTESFSSRVGDMAKRFAAFVGPIAAVGAAFLGARGIVNSFRDAIDIGGKLNDLSARTGETAGNLAILQRAFENAGSSGEAVGPMLNRLQRFMVEAANGGKSQTEAMNKLGLSYEMLKSMSPTAQMELLAQRISAIPDPAQRSAFAMDIFGRSGGELMPLLRGMAGELETARQQLGSYPGAIDRANKALDDIGDNFAAVSTKAREFVTGALVEIAPMLAGVGDRLAKIDFAGMGMKLASELTKVFDFFVGLWQAPKQIFGLLADYLNATFRQAGDSLLSAFLTAGNALSSLFNQLVERGAFGKLGEVLANAFIYGTQRFNLLMFDAIESVVLFFGRLWNSATTEGADGFAKKLSNVVNFFASDFVQAMTNPLAFITNKMAQSLVGATKQAADEYQFAFDSATGSYIEKARAGLQSVVDGSGARLKTSSEEFGSIVVASSQTAAANSEIVKVNLFGGAEAVAQVNERVSQIAAQGAQFRVEMQDSVAPAQEVASAIATLPEKSLSLQEALERSFPLATGIKNEAAIMAREGQLFESSVNNAKIDAEVTASVFTGLSDRMREAVNSTSQSLDKMREAFHFGRQTSEQVYQKSRDAGMSLVEASRQASQHSLNQAKAEADMRQLEQKTRLAESSRDREYERAARREQAGQINAAHNIRMRADARFTSTLEKISPQLKEGAQRAGEALSKTGDKTGGNISGGGDKAANSMAAGGRSAGKHIETAASALKDAVKDMGQALALEQTLQQCREFLKSIDKKLPQNSLS
jgi:hypothetical protein